MKLEKNKKGFTLIELLAVIVILGLLLAIAIPSVTKYITQSRKKTVVSSIDGYISSTVNSVNEQDYKFSTPNTIYAIPIECIAIEKGGTNPFGEWLHANNNYWAYVLVQYDNENFSYTYGFTFKDSTGYGMYPTIQSEINPKSTTQIKTGLELTKPTSGKATDVTTEDNWNGFKVDSDTNLVVLEAETEGNKGNGETTCTLCQKGNNYEQVEEEKEATVKTVSIWIDSNELTIQYKEGMTWGEWVSSKYNTMGLTLNDDNVFKSEEGYVYYLVGCNSFSAKDSDLIKEDIFYMLEWTPMICA